MLFIITFLCFLIFDSEEVKITCFDSSSGCTNFKQSSFVEEVLEGCHEKYMYKCLSGELQIKEFENSTTKCGGIPLKTFVVGDCDKTKEKNDKFCTVDGCGLSKKVFVIIGSPIILIIVAVIILIVLVPLVICRVLLYRGDQEYRSLLKSSTHSFDEEELEDDDEQALEEEEEEEEGEGEEGNEGYQKYVNEAYLSYSPPTRVELQKKEQDQIEQNNKHNRDNSIVKKKRKEDIIDFRNLDDFEEEDGQSQSPVFLPNGSFMEPVVGSDQ